MKVWLFLTFSVLFGGVGIAQKEIVWEKLEIKKLREISDTVNKITYDIPVFPEGTQKLEGKKILIEGYFNLIESNDDSRPNLFLLQRYAQFDYGIEYPLDALIEVQFKSPPEFLNSRVLVKVQGKLKLNATDLLHPFYILEKAKVRDDLL